MRSLVRGVGVVFGLVVVLSLVGATQLAGLLGALGLLVTVLATALQSSRPRSGRGTPRSARSPSFLARYRPADEAESLSGLVIAAFAAWEILEFLDLTNLTGLSAGLFIPLVAYIVFPNAVALVLGVGGSLAVTAGLVLERGDCADTASAAGLLVYAGVLATAALVVMAVRGGWMGLRRPLRDRIGRGAWALIMFGLLDVAAFVVHPNGIEIWTAAPIWAAPVVLMLVVAVAFFASYAPGFILGLTALGVAFGQGILGVAAADVVIGLENPCGDPGLGVGYAIAFVVFAVAGLSLRSGRR